MIIVYKIDSDIIVVILIYSERIRLNYLQLESTKFCSIDMKWYTIIRGDS